MLKNEHELFDRDGVVIIRGLFKDWIPLLETGVKENEQNPGQWFRDYPPPRKPKVNFGLIIVIGNEFMLSTHL
ncbi:hypothetical protein SKM54_09475 [Acinetobacter faecalis]|uniref:hypothetical protein n=1 Tax=Acinetobacter faecalis TaxID=2665161 RepID=UPI002A9199EE|nr:hypothetical protein [Acinetobacter faecalis]MDY6482673.1 hypothetical protein [Acinetobacter faecalis]